MSGPGPNAARGNTLAPRTTIDHQEERDQRRTDGEQAERGSGRHVCTPATLVASAATPSSNSDHSGIRGIAKDSPSIRWRAGNAPGTNAAIATVMTANDPKAQRQIPNWAKIPPMAGPTITLTPHIADTNADALVHSQFGRAALITA